MKKYSTIAQHIAGRLSKVKDYLSSEDKVGFAYFFGSIAKGRMTPFSDIDIAIYVTGVKDLTNFKLRILSKLIDTLESDKVDLVILNSASLFLKAQVLQQKIILVDKDPFLRHRFESLILREYFDFSIKEQEIFKRRYAIG